MAWFMDRRRERRDPRLAEKQAFKPAPVATPEQKVELAEREEFKIAPLAIDTNLPVPAHPKPAKQASALVPAPSPSPSPLVPTPAPRTATPAATPAKKNTTKTKVWNALRWAWVEEETEIEEETKKKEEEAKKKAEEEAKKKAAEAKAKAAQPVRAAAAAPKTVSKPAPTVTVTVNKPGLTREEIAALKAKEAVLEAKVDRARQAFKTLAANEEKAEEAYKAYPAYAKQTIGWLDEMLDMAAERADMAAAAHYRRKIAEVRRDEPPKPKDEKPTFEQYMANPSRYKHKGKTGVSSSYSPTKSDVAKQPFKPLTGACTGWSAGYKAAENCKQCRAMGEASGTHIHCPCGCGNYIPIDRNYNPFGGEASPDFKEGKSSTRLW